jgi:hypothetical protein
MRVLPALVVVRVMERKWRSEVAPGGSGRDGREGAPTAANLACDATSGGTWTVTPGSNETRPINCVNWWEAYAFCIWDGGFLPKRGRMGMCRRGRERTARVPVGKRRSGHGKPVRHLWMQLPDKQDVRRRDGAVHRAGRDGIGRRRTLESARPGRKRLAVDPGFVRELRPVQRLHQFRGCARSAAGRQLLRPPADLFPSFRAESDRSSRYNFYGVRCARRPG